MSIKCLYTKDYIKSNREPWVQNNSIHICPKYEYYCFYIQNGENGKRMVDSISVVINGCEVIRILGCNKDEGWIFRSINLLEYNTIEVKITGNACSLIKIRIYGIQHWQMNNAPLVNVGNDQVLILPNNTISLNGYVCDDGLPCGVLDVMWQVICGSEDVYIKNIYEVCTTATFNKVGSYILRLIASDSELVSCDEMRVEVLPKPLTNQAPVVNAGGDQSITLPVNTVTLNGAATDDGLPVGILTNTWSKVSGPGNVTFEDEHDVKTKAIFSEAGSYVLRLTASDTALESTDEMRVEVLPESPVNQAPVVDAGVDQSITLPENRVVLNGSATDDGLPSGVLIVTWEVVSGEGIVVFENPNQPVTAATFNQAGHYVLRLTATDTEKSSSDEVAIEVKPYTVYRTYTTDADFNEGEKINLSSDIPDQLQLSGEARGLNYLWVAVSSKGTVVKINTDTGEIEGEYWTSPDGQPKDPSRTTVDLNGNVWVANRAGNSVVRIGLVENGQWIDKNANGVLETSSGFGNVRSWTNVGEADTNGGVSTAQDEGILNYVKVNSFGTRHISVNKDNDVWVSGTEGKKFDLIDGKTGEIKRSEPSVGYGGYGGLIDKNGVIWSARPLLRWDTALPLTGPNGGNWRGYDHDSYGLAIDKYGNVWNTSYLGDRIYKFAPDGNLIGVYRHGSGDATRGCAADQNGDIWVAHTWDLSIGHLKNDGTYVGKVKCQLNPQSRVGDPTGVAVDNNGKIWITNDGVGTVMRINPTLGPLGEDGVTPVGAIDFETEYLGGNLYNYSDMTGSTLLGTPQEGSWNVIFDGKQPGVEWGTIGWNGTIYNDSQIKVAVATSEDGVTFSSQYLVTNRSNFTIPNGRYIKISVTLIRSTDGRSPILTDLTIGNKGYIPPDQLNQEPIVEAGIDAEVRVNKTLQLQGFVQDDCLPTGEPLVILWSQVSGPGSISFSEIDQVITEVTFSEIGEYVLRLEASDLELVGSDEIQVKVLEAINEAPVVDAGQNLTIVLPEQTVTLQGSVTDDGLPSGTLSIHWEKISGSGIVTFTAPDQQVTKATFSEAGHYVLRLTASDTALESYDEMTVDVLTEPPINKPPVVDAGEDQTITLLEQTVTLHGVVTDDGIPSLVLQILWSVISGSGEVVFGTPNQAITTATFSKVGRYVLRLTASDTELTGSDDVTIDVVSDNQPPVVDAGPDQVITLPQYIVTLKGKVTDDGLPSNTLLIGWQVVSGVWPVTFSPPDQAETTVTFYSEPGEYVLRLSASDTELGSSDEVRVNILPRNRPPVVNAGEDQRITLPEHTVNLYGVVTDDGLPAGTLLIAWQVVSGTGPVTFVPPDQAETLATFSEPGQYFLRLSASDTELESSDEVRVDVFESPINRAPVVNAGEDQTIRLPEQTVTLHGVATDDGLPAGELLITWQVVSGTGLVTFIPPDQAETVATFSQPGHYILRLSASDTELESSDEVRVDVLPPSLPDLERPVVQGTINPETVTVNNPVTITITATDNIGVVSQTLLVNGENVSLDASGQAIYTPLLPGVFKVVATAFDAAGNEGYWEGEFLAITEGDTTPPTVEITSPAEFDKINRPITIIGTASDEHLVFYKLEYALKDQSFFTTFASGTTSVVGGTLGTFDPTLLENGFYDVRLTAIDESGNQSVTLTTYQLDGNMKVGYFTLTFEDLLIPVSGIPVNVTRTYDSRNKSLGDFGIGWTLSLRNIRISESCVPGKFWRQYSEGDLPPIYYVQETKKHKVVVTYPDGSTDEFRIVLDPSSSVLYPIDIVEVSYEAMEGTFSTLEALTSNTCYVVNSFPGVELQTTDFNVYNPNRYKLTTKEGIVYIINQLGGLESITDRNGNTITFSYDGILHSDGKGVAFVRDSVGRITSIIDPMGNAIRYSYDFYSDLVSVLDQENNQTTFRYNNNHDVIDIYDPLGVRAIRNEYDAEGRLIASIDTLGNRVEYTHDIGGNQEIVRDRLGNVTIFEYDDNGNVLQKTDALGNVTSYTYDANDNMLTETNALGYTTTHTYDARNNRLSTTDPLGNTTENTYNSKGQILTTKDPNGNISSTTYDSSGNALSMTDYEGNITSFTYDDKGNITSMTTQRGYVKQYTIDAFGNTISTTDEEGNTTNYTYDGNNNQLSVEITRMIDGILENITTQYEYDNSNRVVKTIDAIGNQEEVVYNASGKEASLTDKRGNRRVNEYDELGKISKKYTPDSLVEQYTYDAEGRRITSIDVEGRVTGYEYDKVGRMIKTTLADGSLIIKEYDATGKILKDIDALGNAMTYTYDEAGRKTLVTDALGFSIRYEYDNNGNMIKMIDQNGNMTQYQYDDNNRVIKKIYPDGTFSTTEYDASGFTIAETDPLGNQTHYEYTEKGRLQKVIDAENGETAYAYDEEGNMLTMIDANNHITQMAYDKLNRLIKRTLPMGQYEIFTYDEAGNEITHSDFNGNTMTKSYDVMNRIIKINYPDGTQKEFTYTGSGKRSMASDTSGKVVYEYDELDRVAKKTATDGRVIEYTYDSVGNKIGLHLATGTINYSYNARKQMITVSDLESQITTYAYDGVGNKTDMRIPNGSVMEYNYDSLNRVKQVMHKNSLGESLASYTYTRDLTGNIRKEIEGTGRTVEYDYDVTYKLLMESVTNTISDDSLTEYSYDIVGNRLHQEQDGVVQNYSYDANNRLLSDGINSYTYDNNGNTLSKNNMTTTIQYSYDYDNKLIKVVSVNGSTTTIVEYGYDAEGIRVQKVVDGVKTLYTVDTNQRYYKVIEERNESDDLIASYVYGQSLISQKRGAEKVFYHLDGHGNIRFLTDIAGSNNNAYIYDAFGQLISKTGTMINEFLYRAEQYDKESNLYYSRNRYMSPLIGRFMTMDTYEGSEYNTFGLNKYLYANANPVNYYDPSGEYSLTEVSITASIIAILTIPLVALVADNRVRIANPEGKNAQNIAKRYVDASLIVLNEVETNRIAKRYYEKYFGKFNNDSYNYVKLGFKVIRRVLNEDIKYTFKNMDAYASTDGRSAKLEMNLGPKFFGADMEGRDSRIGIIIHELVHVTGFDLNPRNEDSPQAQGILFGEEYGASAIALAESNPLWATENADNYEYFAEDVFDIDQFIIRY